MFLLTLTLGILNIRARCVPAGSPVVISAQRPAAGRGVPNGGGGGRSQQCSSRETVRPLCYKAQRLRIPSASSACLSLKFSVVFFCGLMSEVCLLSSFAGIAARGKSQSFSFLAFVRGSFITWSFLTGLIESCQRNLSCLMFR